MLVLRSLAVVLSLALSAAALVGAPAASAGDGETAKIVRSQRVAPDQEFEKCEGSSKVKLKITAEADGRLEVVGVVFSEGMDVWSWKFKHDGDFSASGRVLAKEREVDRSFRVVRAMVNFVGPDVVSFRAVNDATGELCTIESVYEEDFGRLSVRDSR
ncbi:MAG: hypothetical protein WKF79_02645 [Nocardioides sp.]